MRGSRVTSAVVFSLFVVFGLGTAAATAQTISPGDILVVDENVGVVRHYSASGTDLGLFATGLNTPAWITTDRSGNVYVTEYQGKKIDKFSPTGQVLLTITTLYLPGGVAIGSDGFSWFRAQVSVTSQHFLRRSEWLHQVRAAQDGRADDQARDDGLHLDEDLHLGCPPAVRPCSTVQANARSAKGDLDGALKDYDEAICLKPDYAIAYYNRGRARKAKGDLEGALKDYGEIIRLKPDYAEVEMIIRDLKKEAP
jgi:TPR repeat